MEKCSNFAEVIWISADMLIPLRYLIAILVANQLVQSQVEKLNRNLDVILMYNTIRFVINLVNSFLKVNEVILLTHKEILPKNWYANTTGRLLLSRSKESTGQILILQVISESAHPFVLFELLENQSKSQL